MPKFETKKLAEEYALKHLKEHGEATILLAISSSLRSKIVPCWTMFLVLDYVYLPQYIYYLVVVRLFVATIWWNANKYLFLAKGKTISLESFALILMTFGTTSINLMIYMSQDQKSPYILGLIVVVEVSRTIFQLTSRGYILASCAAYFPLTAVLIAINIKNHNPLTDLFVTIAMVAGFIILSLLVLPEEKRFISGFTNKISELVENVRDLRDVEILSQSFPDEMIPVIAALKSPMKIPDAVVGFADLIASTRIAEILKEDDMYSLIDELTQKLAQIAKECKIVISNHTGDGIFFVANFDGSKEWLSRVREFFERSQVEVILLLAKWEHRFAAEGIKSGLKISLNQGPIKMGNLGNKFFFTGIGRAINTAARMCEIGEDKEIVVSRDIWKQISRFMDDDIKTTEETVEFKNVKDPVEVVHISSKQAKTGAYCKTCNAELVYLENKHGHATFKCPKGHKQ